MQKSNYTYLLKLFLLSIFVISVVATPIMAQGVISGRITDTNATPHGISGAIVDAYKANDRNACPTIKGMAVTDVNGAYHIYPLEHGKYIIRAYALGYLTNSSLADTCVTSCAFDYNLTLKDTNGSVIGHVFQPDGITPIEGATVKAYYPGTENVIASSTTSSEGNYTISNIGGLYEIEASGVGWLPKKIRVDVPHPSGVIIQDFVLLPGPYYDPNAVFMGWIEIGDLTVAGDYTILLKDLQRRHPIMPPERGILEVYRKGTMVMQQVVVPGDTLYIDEIIKIKVNEINDHENAIYFGRYKLNITITKTKEPELSINLTTLYRGEIDDKDRTFLRGSREGIKPVILGEVDINASSGSVEFDGKTYSFNVSMINKDIQYVYNFKEVNGSFVYPDRIYKGDIITFGKDNSCKNIRQLTIYEMSGSSVLWTPIIHSIMRPEDFEFETENEIEKPQSDTTFWYVTEIQNTGGIQAKNIKIHITAKDFIFLTGNKCYCGSDKEACLEIKSMEPDEKRLILFKFKAPHTDYLKISPIQIDLSYQRGYFNEKGHEIIQDYSKSDKTLITIVPKQPEFQITRNIVKENLFVGETTDVEIRIKNIGDITATKINLIDYIPDGFELIDGSATTTINKMTKNETFTLIYKVKALEMGKFEFKSQLLFEDEAGKKYKTTSMIEPVTVSKEFPRLEILKKLDRVTISRGDSVIVVLVVRNTGNKIARNVQVLDFVPEGFRLIDTPKIKKLEYTIPELKPEQEKMFKYIITASLPGEYKIGDTKLLYYDLEGHSFEHIASGTSVRVNGEPKITISNIQYFNEDYSFADYKYVDVVQTLTNTGDGLAKKISYINSISGDIELVDGELGGFLDNLKQGDSKTTKFTVRVRQENKDKTFTINTSSEFEDIAGKKNKSDALANITVGGRTPTIQLSRQDSEYKSDIIRIGHIIPVTTIITNTGDGDAKNVRIEDKIPSNLQVTTGINYWGGQLKPGEKVTLRYTLVPSQGGEYQIGQTLSTYEDEWGVKGTKSLSSALVTVWGPSIARTISNNEIEEGEILKITYDIKNWGKDDIYEVKLVENIPQGFEIVSGTNDLVIGEIKAGTLISKEIQIKATKSGAFIFTDSKLYWKNVFEEVKSFDIERTTISVKAKVAPQTILPNIPQSVTQTIQEIKSSPYASYILIGIIMVLLSIVGFSVYKSFRPKGSSIKKPLTAKIGTTPLEKISSKKDKATSKKEFRFFSKRKEKKAEQKVTKDILDTQLRPVTKKAEEAKNIGFFVKKEKLPSQENVSSHTSPAYDAETKFGEFVKRDKDSIMTRESIDKELLGKKVAPPSIKKVQKSKFSLFSKKKEGIPQEKKPFSFSHLYESQQPKNYENGNLGKELDPVDNTENNLLKQKEKPSIDYRKRQIKYASPINYPVDKEIRPPKVNYNPPEDMKSELGEIKKIVQDETKMEAFDSFEIESLRSEISKTLEETEKKKENIALVEKSMELEDNSKIDLLNRKELDELQIKIINQINELESKKYVDPEERKLKEIKGKVIPKEIDLGLPPSVEMAYKEYKQKKSKEAPENPFKDKGNESIKNSSWTSNFKYNNTSPEIPASIKELLEKTPSNSNDTYVPVPDVKEIIKGKKEANKRYFSNNSVPTPDPKEIIKGKKKD